MSTDMCLKYRPNLISKYAVSKRYKYERYKRFKTFNKAIEFFCKELDMLPPGVQIDERDIQDKLRSLSVHYSYDRAPTVIADDFDFEIDRYSKGRFLIQYSRMDQKPDGWDLHDIGGTTLHDCLYELNKILLVAKKCRYGI